MPADPLSAWFWAHGVDVKCAVEGLALCMLVTLIWGVCLNVVEWIRR